MFVFVGTSGGAGADAAVLALLGTPNCFTTIGVASRGTAICTGEGEGVLLIKGAGAGIVRVRGAADWGRRV